MSNYEHIMTQCRRFRSKKWDEAELRKCKELLCTLSREELFNVYRSRFLLIKHPLKEAAFKVLFSDKIGKRADSHDACRRPDSRVPGQEKRKRSPCKERNARQIQKKQRK